MRHYYTAEVIRAAEAPLLASLPEGTLMRRAATGLAGAVASELRRTGGVRGRSVCAVVGSGNNGGDALWAATLTVTVASRKEESWRCTPASRVALSLIRRSMETN